MFQQMMQSKFSLRARGVDLIGEMMEVVMDKLGMSCSKNTLIKIETCISKAKCWWEKTGNKSANVEKRWYSLNKSYLLEEEWITLIASGAQPESCTKMKLVISTVILIAKEQDPSENAWKLLVNSMKLWMEEQLSHTLTEQDLKDFTKVGKDMEKDNGFMLNYSREKNHGGLCSTAMMCRYLTNPNPITTKKLMTTFLDTLCRRLLQPQLSRTRI